MKQPPSCSLYQKRLQNYPPIGAAFADALTEQGVEDHQLLQFLQDYMGLVLLAKQAGVNINGYFVCTLMDNFEWAEGFYPQVGLIYVDFLS